MVLIIVTGQLPAIKNYPASNMSGVQVVKPCSNPLPGEAVSDS